MFFPSGEFDPRSAAALIAREALLSGVSDVAVRREADWWLIESSEDWLPPPLDSEAFQRLVPFAEGAPNSSRSEILLTAFARDVATGNRGNMTTVKGTAAPSVGSQPGRVVAFRI